MVAGDLGVPSSPCTQRLRAVARAQSAQPGAAGPGAHTIDGHNAGHTPSRLAFLTIAYLPTNQNCVPSCTHTKDGQRVMPASKRVSTAGRGEAKGVISIPCRWPWGHQAASEMPALPICAMSEHYIPHTIPALVTEIAIGEF